MTCLYEPTSETLMKHEAMAGFEARTKQPNSNRSSAGNRLMFPARIEFKRDIQYSHVQVAPMPSAVDRAAADAGKRDEVVAVAAIQHSAHLGYRRTYQAA